MITKMSAFTLLETVLVGGLALVVGTFLVAILVSNTGFFYQQTSVINEGLSLNDALQKINNKIKEAVEISSGYPPLSPIYISGAETLILKLPAISQSGVLINTYDFATVFKDTAKPNILRLQVFPDQQSVRRSSSEVLTTLLDTINFLYIDKDGNQVATQSAVGVKTTLTVLSKTGSVGSKRSSTTTTFLRNVP